MKSVATEALVAYEAAGEPIFEQTKSLTEKITTFPSPKPIHIASGGSDSAICPSDHLALAHCLKSKAPQDCTSLMTTFSACSAKFHLDQQVKRAMAPRQL